MRQWIVVILCAMQLVACDDARDKPFQGYVEGENIYIASPFSGVLVKKYFERGQEVKKGALLFQLDNNPQKFNVGEVEDELSRAQHLLTDLNNPSRAAELAAIEAKIKQAEAKLRLASLRVKRYERLQKQQASDKDTLDAAIARHDELEYLKAQYIANLDLARQGARVEQIDAQRSMVASLVEKLAQSRWQLAQKSVYAPTDGVIFDTYFREGEFVPSQQPLASLLAPENIRIEFFVPVQSLARIKLGQKINFTCVGCREKNTAVIQYISSEAEYIPPLVYSDKNYSKLVYRIKAIIDRPMQFKPGQPVMVNVNSHE